MVELDLDDDRTAFLLAGVLLGVAITKSVQIVMWYFLSKPPRLISDVTILAAALLVVAIVDQYRKRSGARGVEQ